MSAHDPLDQYPRPDPAVEYGVAPPAGAARPQVATVFDVRHAAQLNRVKAMAELQAPFLTVHSLEPQGTSLRMVSDRFVGVSAARAALALHGIGRRLPLDVWLALMKQLLEAIETFSAEHPFWHRWFGPHAMGVDLDARFVMFGSYWGAPVPPGFVAPYAGYDLHSDWVDWQHQGRSGLLATRVYSVAKVGVWLLDPFDFEYLHLMQPPLRAGPGRRWRAKWAHPHVSAALAQVLNAGLERAPGVTLSEWRQQVLEQAKVEPASPERLASVIHGAGHEHLQWLGRQLATEPELLPERWQRGALLVRIDELLEQASLPHACPPAARAIALENDRGDALAPLTPTTGLSLAVSHQGTVRRRTVVSAALGLPERVRLEAGSTLAAGAPVTLTIQHPVQKGVTVELQAVADGQGWAVMQAPMAGSQERLTLDHLLRSLDPKAQHVQAGVEEFEATLAPTLPRPRTYFERWVRIVSRCLGYLEDERKSRHT